MEPYAAIVLAGGRGQRLGGLDKAALLVTPGQTLLDRALTQVNDADRVVVVGAHRDLPEGVVQVSEQPPGGGPAAAVIAGLAEVAHELVLVLACDMPLLQPRDIERLVRCADADGIDGALYVDPDGRRQPLAAVYRAASLRAAAALLPTTSGVSMRDLIRPLTLTEVTSDPELTLDCDTWEELARVRALLDRRDIATDKGGPT